MEENSSAGMKWNTPTLFTVAKSAYENSRDDLFNLSNAALTSIIFSSISLECFINELGNHSKQLGDSEPAVDGLKQIGQFVDLMGELELGKEAIRLKFLLAKNILTGTPFDKGKSPYQDFDLLLKVRNALVHFRSENLYLATDTFSGMIQPEVKPDSIDRLFSKLRSKNILKPEEDCHQGGLIERISTPEAAKWACNIVPDMISETLLGCPDDFNLFRLGLEGLIAKIP